MLKDEKALQQKISACLVIYNEERVLDRCLSSIKNVVDEIVIVHDGKCTDKSLQIAKKYNAKIFVRKHVGEAEYHRPFAFSKANGDWILHIDADEYLGSDLQKEIPKFTSQIDFDALSVRWPVWDPENRKYLTSGPYGKMFRTLLFRKRFLYMLGLTHFHPSTRGTVKRRNDLVLHHRPSKSVFSIAEYRRKILNWSEIYNSQIQRLDELPFFGAEKQKVEVLSKTSKQVASPFKTMSIQLLVRIAWFARYGGLWSGTVNYRFLFFDLSHIYHRYMCIIKS